MVSTLPIMIGIAPFQLVAPSAPVEAVQTRLIFCFVVLLFPHPHSCKVLVLKAIVVRLLPKAISFGLRFESLVVMIVLVTTCLSNNLNQCIDLFK